MQSKIDIAEFKSRLSKNTLIGNPNINGTPLVVFSIFYSSNHKFFGRINKNTFEITTNSTFQSIPYKIKGAVNSAANATTSVEYTIKPIWFGYLWIRIIPVLFILLISAVIIEHPDLIFPLGIFGSTLLLLFIYNIYRIEGKLKNFEIDFKKTFQII